VEDHERLARAQEAVRKAVKHRQVELGLTRDQIADDGGVPLRTVGRFLSEGVWPRPPALRGIARGLGWPPDELEVRLKRELNALQLSDLTSSVQNVIVVDFGPDGLDGLAPEEVRELQAGIQAAGLRLKNEIKARTPVAGFQVAS
jgi:hypothetical protein